MKKIFVIVSAIGLLISTSGCKDWLDVRPENEVVLEDFWQNESQVNQVMSACYRALTEGDVMSRMMVWGELRSDNVANGPGMDEAMTRMLNVDITTANGLCTWGSFYTVINYCNNFLYYAPDVVEKDANFTISKYRSMEAEVLTIRALAYFYLVRTFKEVPLIVEPSISDAQDYRIPKSTEDEILNYIMADLNVALSNARNYYEKTSYTKGRITKNAVRALMADIYLWQEQYDQCVNMCDQIINDTQNPLELVDGEDVIQDVFYLGNSTESIFELQFDDDNMFNGIVRDYLGGRGRIAGLWSFPYQLVIGQFSPFRYRAGGGTVESEEDLREVDFLRNSGERFNVFKYAGVYRQEGTTGDTYYYRSNTANWIVYRLSDVLLMKSEALIQLGTNNAEALKLINTTYLRSNPELLGDSLRLENYSSKFELENLLLRERQRELMFEGKRWFDLMRIARREDSPTPLLNYVSRKFSGGGSGGTQITKMSVMDALYLPIHIDELKANSALVQNPFYEVEGESSTVSQ